MFAAVQNYRQIVNFLSLRTKHLNEEDKQGMTILMHQLIQRNYKMATRLIFRGANYDYVNVVGKTAIQICVEKGLVE